MKNIKIKRSTILLVVLAVLLVTATATFAFSDIPDYFRAHTDVDLERAEYIKGPVFYAGNQVRLAGTIDGTAFLAGTRVVIDGTVDGSLFVAGQEVVINGVVTGNLYAAGQEVRINGQVIGDVIGAGRRVHTSESGVLERDMLVAAETIFSSGTINRQMLGAGVNVVINGAVGDDVKLAVEQLEIRNSASISGNLYYTSPYEAQVGQQSEIAGDVTWRHVDERVIERRDTSVFEQLFKIGASIVAALIVWYVIYVLSPNFWRGASEPLRKTPFKTLGIGLLLLIATPIIAVIAITTVVGIPVGLITLAVYGTSLYFTKIILAAAIGYLLADKLGWTEKHGGIWLVLLGLVVILILTSIPYIKIITYIVMVLGGLGSLLMYLLNKDNKDEPTDDELADY
ncbi:polymer-forming cytoskeletal protein [Desulfuribacillus alkaliarsenatis]|uniref:DUF8173 domain-containing protein n=1 Tax=Desulfuribacillus alkaliarsenatis TaxID=766136 RepID=A0A1E5G1B6_9FIRM|nr:polymer-forming cytoskeletal protein [Desulfuribacillus alkaliarsenatis]OEF96698.1 hypothetical protein BHF68_06380 [Desulfuribacillus alkaliarsenatis]